MRRPPGSVVNYYQLFSLATETNHVSDCGTEEVNVEMIFNDIQETFVLSPNLTTPTLSEELRQR